MKRTALLAACGHHRACLRRHPSLRKHQAGKAAHRAPSVGGSVSQMNKIAYFVALNKKYFEQEGLTVEPTKFSRRARRRCRT